jgi:hypothetical protein
MFKLGLALGAAILFAASMRSGLDGRATSRSRSGVAARSASAAAAGAGAARTRRPG